MILALFFTRSVSLETWLNAGLFDREKLIYEAHLSNGIFKKIYWFTYGTKDSEIARQLKAARRLHPGIEVVSMPRVFRSKIGMIAYSFLMPLVQRSFLKQADIYKTNQMAGSWSAVLSKVFFGRPLVIRTGYTLSTFTERMQSSIGRVRIYQLMEWVAYKAATHAIVASQQDSNFIMKKYHCPPDKITILPNYIDTESFKPLPVDQHAGRIVFVGRLNEQKNIFNLITAVAKTDFILDIYGQGELRDALGNQARRMGTQVNFLGIVPNSELPKVLNKYKYYILPSLFEGMPKTLLEAMACGCICIGTDVDGINEVISDDVNGFLAAGVDAEALHRALCKASTGNNDRIAIQAVETIRERFSLMSIVKSEKKIYLQVSEIH